MDNKLDYKCAYEKLKDNKYQDEIMNIFRYV